MINQTLLLAGDDAYNLSKSLRFRSSASAYLNKTLTTPTDNKKWTWSAWVKRGGGFGTIQSMFSAGTSTNECFIYFDGTNNIGFDLGYTEYRQTAQVFRDPAAWYHIIVVVDTANATAQNRARIYVNGNEVTSWGINSTITQNATFAFNSATEHNLSRFMFNSSNFFDGYMTEINFIDGQALTPSSFGETDVLTGVWKPKKYAGTYGTNGFYLPFTDVATTSGSNAGLGKDFSGNGNYWTTNNISVTAGTTYDSMSDVPTLTSATTANYCVMNPLTADSNATFSNGNLTIASNTTGEGFIPATIDFSITTSTGYYFEVTVDSNPAYCTTGFIPVSKFSGKMWTSGTYPGQSTYNPGFEIRFSDGNILQNGGSSAYGSGATAGDTWGFAIKNGKVWARNSSGWFNSGNPVTEANPAVTGQTGQWLLGYAERAGGFGAQCTFNFGAGSGFAYTPPTGFVALNTFNLPEPSIKQGNKHMDAVLWTGNATYPRNITGLNFQPDFVWAKTRSNAYDHILYDVLRGTGAHALSSNNTDAEGTYGTNNNNLTSFNSNGFTLGSTSSTDVMNGSGITEVAWNWKANGAGSSNTAGSITSTVSANPTAGFSVVTFTAGSGNQTVGHGLGVAPSMVILKRRNSTSAWITYHSALSNPATSFLELNTTAAVQSATPIWGASGMTSSTIGTSDNITINGATYVAYCFSEVAGYSKFGSYTGNGSADGPFIYTGFRPKFVLIKCSTNTYNWVITDTSRDIYNTAEHGLYPNLSNAEGSGYPYMDILSNGFKQRYAGGGANASGETFIYMAFAENPFKNSLAR